MAVTVAITDHGTLGKQRTVQGTITFDSSYPTGGEAFDPGLIGLVRVSSFFFEMEDGFLFKWDAANEKILAFESGTASAALDEQDAATDLSGAVVRFLAVGT